MDAQKSSTSYDIVNDTVSYVGNDVVNVVNDFGDDMVDCVWKPNRAAHRTTP